MRYRILTTAFILTLKFGCLISPCPEASASPRAKLTPRQVTIHCDGLSQPLTLNGLKEAQRTFSGCSSLTLSVKGSLTTISKNRTTRGTLNQRLSSPFTLKQVKSVRPGGVREYSIINTKNLSGNGLPHETIKELTQLFLTLNLRYGFPHLHANLLARIFSTLSGITPGGNTSPGPTITNPTVPPLPRVTIPPPVIPSRAPTAPPSNPVNPPGGSNPDPNTSPDKRCFYDYPGILQDSCLNRGCPTKQPSGQCPASNPYVYSLSEAAYTCLEKADGGAQVLSGGRALCDAGFGLTRHGAIGLICCCKRPDGFSAGECLEARLAGW